MPRKVTSTVCLGPCGRGLPADAFSENPHLVGGRSPWCRDCVASLAASGADVREDYRKAYQRAYQAKRADDAGGAKRPCWRVSLPAGRAKVVLSRANGTVRISGTWRMHTAMMSLAERIGGTELTATGSGGGSGRGKRHKRVVVVGDVDVGEAEKVLEGDVDARRTR